MLTMETTPPALSDTEALSTFLSDVRANLSIGLWKKILMVVLFWCASMAIVNPSFSSLN